MKALIDIEFVDVIHRDRIRHPMPRVRRAS